MEVAAPISRAGTDRHATAAPAARRNTVRPRGGARILAAILLATALPSLTALTALAADVAAAGKVLRVATSGDYAPFSFTTAPPAPGAAPAFDGFDVEVATRFARDRGYRLELFRFRWPDLPRELAAGSFDVAMSGVTVRPERSIAGRLSVPVAATHAVALTWKGSGASTFDELDRQTRRIAVNAGGHLEKVAREVFRRADVYPLADNEAVRMALLDRTFDAVVTDNYEEKVWSAGQRDVVRIGPLSDDRKAYLLPADRDALAAELDRWLVGREQDGTLAQLRQQYFAADAIDTAGASAAGQPARTAEPIPALAAAIVERLALMPMVYAAKKHAGLPIEDRTQEAAVLDGAVRAVTAQAEAAARETPAAGQTNGAATTAVDADAVRELFEALIEIGKDAQQKLADTDVKRRPGVVRYRPSATTGGDDAAKAADPVNASAATPAAADAAAANDPGADLSARRTVVRDLGGELRPAIARITDKIACILVAIEQPIAAADARRGLANALAPHAVRPQHIEKIASAVARLSAAAPPAR